MLSRSGLSLFQRSKTHKNSQIFTLGSLKHVGIAVADLDNATNHFESVLNANVTEKKDLPNHGVTAGMS